MEFIDGTSLAEVIAERRHLSEDELLGVFVEMLGILDYLHSCVPPVLHRDIKPANIILRPGGVPALVDFGAVRNVFRTADESGSTVAGTYGYMPYEQYMGQATPASDLYALGATFLHLITGRPPPEFIAGEGRIEVPASLPGDPLLREILVRLLRPSPADRFGDAGEVRRILLRQRGISGTPQAADTGEGAIVSPMNSRRTVSGIAIPISCCP
jgi:serine/threonine protein kinase